MQHSACSLQEFTLLSLIPGQIACGLAMLTRVTHGLSALMNGSQRSDFEIAGQGIDRAQEGQRTLRALSSDQTSRDS